MLIRAVGDERRDPSFWQRREADIWDGYGDELDHVAPKVGDALAIAEMSLGSALEAASRPTV
jgi:hypothetical protein